jgi:hypothetical protein
MNGVKLTLILVLAYLAVFAQAAFDTPRAWLGGHINLLPPLIVYAALRLDIIAVAVLAALGGIWLDSLSAGPLGATILPLFAIGWGLERWRDLLLRELDYAQLVLGAAASLCVPVLTLLLTLTKGFHPDLGWNTLWQLLVLTVTGGVLTPALFRLLDKLSGLFSHPLARPNTFRGDREIKRGKY